MAQAAATKKLLLIAHTIYKSSERYYCIATSRVIASFRIGSSF